jgi:hypothetical protein
MKTFSQMVQTVTASVRSQMTRTSSGRASTALIVRHAKHAFRKDGTPDPSLKLVAPVVEAVREELARETREKGGTDADG